MLCDNAEHFEKDLEWVLFPELLRAATDICCYVKGVACMYSIFQHIKANFDLRHGKCSFIDIPGKHVS